MNDKEIKKNHQKHGGKRPHRGTSPHLKHTDTPEDLRISALEADIAAITASETQTRPKTEFFWKSKLPSINESEKLEIECPNYADIPVYDDESRASTENTEGKTEIVGVRFRAAGKVYYFLPYIPDDHGRINSKIIHTKSGDNVIVDTARGTEIGTVFVPNKFIDDQKLEPLKPMRSILRIATEEDLKVSRENEETEKEAEKIFIERVNAHGLPMKLIDIQYTFDRSKLLFYFSSEGRVDFRELVKDLASIFHTRIELRQIGIRDEARIMGGLGACGRPLCCSSFLSDFVQVSIKMAKSQVMSLNPSKISGCCGRLMCCLRYENDTYEEEISKTPPTDSIVKTENGFGTVIEINPLAEMVKVRMTEKCDTPVAFFHRDSVVLTDPKDPEYLAALERARSSVASASIAQTERVQKAQAAQHRPSAPQTKIAPHEDMFANGSVTAQAEPFVGENDPDAQKNAQGDDAKKKQGNNNRKRRGNRQGGHNGADRKENAQSDQNVKAQQKNVEAKSAQPASGEQKSDAKPHNSRHHKQHRSGNGGNRQNLQKPAEGSQGKPQNGGKDQSGKEAQRSNGGQSQKPRQSKHKGSGQNRQNSDRNNKRPE